MHDTKSILIPDATYHVYNRANGLELLFAQEDNYLFFLEKYRHYILPIAQTFCYCLMPNHFHFLIRIKGEKELTETFKVSENLEGLLSNRFSNFFNSYSKAFNKQQNRRGNLFMHTFKRKRITDEKYLCKLVHYIHYNPVEAGFCSNPEDYKFSSFNSILSSSPTLINRNEVIEWFGDKKNFIYCHRYPPGETGIDCN